jgi:hypothetical protein
VVLGLNLSADLVIDDQPAEIRHLLHARQPDPIAGLWPNRCDLARASSPDRIDGSAPRSGGWILLVAGVVAEPLPPA